MLRTIVWMPLLAACGGGGLERYCEKYLECGGSYYGSADACVEASLDYWGECPGRVDALDDFGACMATLECGTYDPDAYNPASTPCSEEWEAISSAGC